MNYIRNHTLNQSEKSTLYHRYVLSTMVSFTFSTSNHSRSSYIISAGNSKPRGYQVILYCKWMWCFSQDQRANELNLTVMRNISGRIQSEYALRLIGRDITPHILRHTPASLLMEQGIDIDTISRRLGHSNSRVTREIYLHVTKKLKEKENARLKNIKLL